MLSNREIRKKFSEFGEYEISKDVIEYVKKDTSKNLEENVRKLIEELDRQNILRKQFNKPIRKRIDRNLYLNKSEEVFKETNSFNSGEVGELNKDTTLSGDNIQQEKSKKDIIKEAIERGYS